MSEIGTDAALIELAAIEEIFDVEYDESDKAAILPAIMDGRFTADPEAETVTYQLVKPIELKNDDVKESITFRTPTNTDMEHINKGFTMKMDKEENQIMDMGAMAVRTRRAVLKLSSLPLGLFDRISRKDMRVFSGLFSFFD